MNAIAERWIGGCRRELPDRTLIWNQNHLRRVSRRTPRAAGVRASNAELGALAIKLTSARNDSGR
jgi:hypothetical protein